MHPGKPDLFDVLLGIVQRAAEVLAKEGPALIYRNGVPDDIEVRIARHIREWEAYGVVDPSNRANSIPDTHEMRFAFAREGLLEVRRHVKPYAAPLDHSDRIRDQPLVVLGQQADDVKHSTKRPGRVSTPAEAEDIDAVARFVSPHQELVSVGNVVRDTITKRESQHPGPPLADSSQRAPHSHRTDSRVVIGNLGRIANQRLVELDHVGITIAELVAGSVATDHYVFRHL